jgi:hypothetical protein
VSDAENAVGPTHVAFDLRLDPADDLQACLEGIAKPR